MSALVYGAVTRKRDESPKDTSTTDKGQPGVKTYIDSMAALVPAEVLLIHGLIVESATETVKGPEGRSITTITEPGWLEAMFWGGIVLSGVMFLVGRLAAKKGKFGGWDWLRMLVPPVAFVLWTILQKTTAFDGAFPDALSETGRLFIGLFGAVLLGLAAAGLGVKANKAESSIGAAGAGERDQPEVRAA